MMKGEIVAAGGVLIDRKNRVLLVHRPRYDDWSFPKGKIDPDETIEKGALREVKEETGLDCRIVRRLTASSYKYRTRRRGSLRPKVVHYFLMKRTSGRLRVPGDEVDQAKWFTLDDAARVLTYPLDRRIIKLLSDEQTIA
jgi:8-oxo-dGTP diphosphatase